MDLIVTRPRHPGFSGADLANLVNEAALNAARQNHKVVTHADFEFAKDKVLMGAERKIAHHQRRGEAEHGVPRGRPRAAGGLLPHADPLHKVTIIPRGMALGLTHAVAARRQALYSKDYLEAQIAILMGGRIAEEMFMDHITTGAGNDSSAPPIWRARWSASGA